MPQDQEEGAEDYSDEENTASNGHRRKQIENKALNHGSECQGVAEPRGILLGHAGSAEAVDIVQVQRELKNDCDEQSF